MIRLYFNLEGFMTYIHELFNLKELKYHILWTLSLYSCNDFRFISDNDLKEIVDEFNLAGLNPYYTGRYLYYKKKTASLLGLISIPFKIIFSIVWFILLITSFIISCPIAILFNIKFSSI